MLSVFKNLFLNYKHLENHILSVIKAQFFVQIVGGAFFLILNIYLAKNSFSDSEIAHFISFRFLAVMLLAFPLGFFIKLISPLCSLIIFVTIGKPNPVPSFLVVKYGFVMFLISLNKNKRRVILLV